jgi:hypothetical protein
MIISTATTVSGDARLVRRPAGPKNPNGTFVGWGPRLGSI